MKKLICGLMLVALWVTMVVTKTPEAPNVRLVVVGIIGLVGGMLIGAGYATLKKK